MLENIRNIIKERLSEEKYIHSLGVEETAKKLAMDFGVDLEKAALAGLLHDYAKNLSKDELFKIIKENNLIISQDELNSYKTLHAPVGAFLVERDLSITDKDILDSIRYHTIGSENMSLLNKIVFIADKIEPNTRSENISKEIIDIINKTKSLDRGMLICYKNTINSLLERDLVINSQTIKFWNYLLLKIKDDSL